MIRPNRSLLWLLLVFFVSRFWITQGRSAGSSDPYKVLGLAPDASPSAIRSSYRRLCLRYHPDKNTHLSESQQQFAEERFKQLQTAYAQIGSPEARKEYDIRRAWFGDSSSSSLFRSATRPGRRQDNDAFAQAFRAFQAQRQAATHTQNHPFFQFYSTTTPSNMFAGRPVPNSNNGFPIWTTAAVKSVYRQRIRVPLQDLYTGKLSVQFIVENCNNICTRYCAAFRGGIAWIILYQSILYTLPLLRWTSKWVLAALTMVLFHQQLPDLAAVASSSSSSCQKQPPTFVATIQPGYKEGTTFTFDSPHPMIQVVFVLMEEEHPLYRRVGNDLHVHVAISPREARQGCQLELPSLDNSSSSSSNRNDENRWWYINVPPGHITQSEGDLLIVPGKGWPIRTKGRRSSHQRYGDLVIHFTLTTPKRTRRRRRKWWRSEEQEEDEEAL